jgi:TPR repeat protein
MSSNDEVADLIDLAERGVPPAQNLLGARLATGSGVQQDVAQALYWYLRASESGYTPAKWNAGSILVDGEQSIRKDLDRGMALIQEAADAYDSSACLFLASCFRNGTYGKQIDKSTARMWESRAWETENYREYDEKRGLSK